MQKVFDSPNTKKGYLEDGNQSPEREVKAGHLMRIPNSKHNSVRMSIAYDKNSTNSPQKNDSKLPINSKTAVLDLDSDKNQWTKREHDWYDIEERLILKNNI